MVNKCPFCGNEKFVEVKQEAYASVRPAYKIMSLKSQTLYHKICLECGSVVQSYIRDPKQFMTKEKM